MSEIVEYLRIQPDQPLSAINVERPFKAVVLAQVEVGTEWQRTVSRWLIGGGALYVSTWGENCESWHDSMDHANLEAWNWGDIPDDQFVMTAWHADEPLEDVLGFAKTTTESYGGIELPVCLLIDIGPEERKDEVVRAYWSAWVD